MIAVDAERMVRHWNHAAEALFGRLAVDAIGRSLEEAIATPEEQRLEVLLASGPSILYSDAPVPGFPNNFTSANAMSVLGVSPTELSGTQFVRRVHPADRDRVAAGLDALLESGRNSLEYRLLHGDGHYRWIRDDSTIVRDHDGNPREIVGYLTDITEERRLSEDRLQLAAAMDQTTDGVVMLQPDGTITYVNAGFCAMTGRSADDLLGSRAEVLADGPLRGSYGEAMFTALGGKRWTGSIHASWRADRPLDLEVAVWPLVIDGQVTSLVAVLRDATMERSLGEALRRQREERDALIRSFGRLPAGATIEERAAALAAEVAAFTGTGLTAVVGFVNGSGVHEIAVDGPRAGVASSLLRACGPALRRRSATQVLETRAAHALAHEGAGCVWDELGIRAMTLSPLVSDGTVFGFLLNAAFATEGVDRLRDCEPLIAEYAAVAAAVLAPAWADRRRITELRAEIESILAERSFSPVFQPVFEIGSRTIVGHESLTRFADGTPPNARFGHAVATGLDLDLESATLEAAMRAARALPDAGWLSLNVSPTLILERSRLAQLLETRDQRRVVLEITEHAAVEDYIRLRRAVRSLGPGIALAVDDAGAGFSSLRHVAELRPQFVKLDMGLVRGVPRDPARQGLIAGMVHFAVSTGCVIVAEGIETEAELRALRRLGVTLGQGFLLGRPQPASTGSRSGQARRPRSA